MQLRKRQVGEIAGVLILALLALVVGLIRPWNHLSLPTTAWTLQRELASPIKGMNGTPLTQPVTKRAWLINPTRLNPREKTYWAHLLHDSRPFSRPLLTLKIPPSPNGAIPVTLHYWTWRSGLSRASKDLLMDRRAAGPWIRVGSNTYEPKAAQAGRTTIQYDLSSQLNHILGSQGSALIVNGSGPILAAQGENSGSLWASRPAGESILPPLLALALNDHRVGQALSQSAVSLNHIGRLWGVKNIRRGLNRLGLGEPAIQGMARSRAVMPSTVDSQTFISGKGLKLSLAALARAYQPLVSGGQESPLRLWSGQSIVRRIPAKFGVVLDQLPSLTIDGKTLYVWRPDGAYTVILDPSNHDIAVLQGSATRRTMEIGALLARTR